MHIAADQLGTAKGLLLRKIEGEFCRRFGTGDNLELHGHTIHGQFRAGLADQIRRRGEAKGAERRSFTQPRANMAALIPLQTLAIHEHGPPCHRRAGDDVLAGCLFLKAGWRNNAQVGFFLV